HRGAPVGRPPRQQVVPVWQQRKKHGELIFCINRTHPLVAEVLDEAGDADPAVRNLLDVIEETVPVPVLPAGNAGHARLPFEGTPPDDVLRIAYSLYEAFL